MTKDLEITTQQIPRTIRERISDFHQTSLAGGLFNLIVFAVIIIPMLLLLGLELIYKSLTGKLKTQKEGHISTPTDFEYNGFKVQTYMIYDDKYYENIKRKFNKSDNDLIENDDLCVIEMNPEIPELTDRIFTYTMIGFDNGIVLQEVNIDNWTSKVLFLNTKTKQLDTIASLEHCFELTFDKTNDNELKILLRHPGHKKEIVIRKTAGNNVYKT